MRTTSWRRAAAAWAEVVALLAWAAFWFWAFSFAYSDSFFRYHPRSRLPIFCAALVAAILIPVSARSWWRRSRASGLRAAAFHALTSIAILALPAAVSASLSRAGDPWHLEADDAMGVGIDFLMLLGIAIASVVVLLAATAVRSLARRSTTTGDGIVGLYERHAGAYDRQRGRGLHERAWLDRFLALVPAGGTVLDLGCGMGEPIARYLIERGYRVVGLDSSPSMIARCRDRFPGEEWIVADMRTLDLARRFDGLVVWDSSFHLGHDDQRALFPRLARHLAPGAPLLFTSGTEEGEAIGTFEGEPLYHASLDTAEYEALLAANGFTVAAYDPHDEECGGHTVWLARRTAS